MRLIAYFFLVYSAAFINAAYALELNLDLTRGKYSSGSLLGISDYYNVENSDLYLSSWYVNIGRSGYLSEDSTGEELTIWSQDLSAGGGLVLFENWSVDWSGYFTRTTETLYQQYGGQLNLSYNANVKVPYTLGLGLSRSKIHQDVYFELFGNPIDREVDIDQSSVEINGSVTFFEKLTFALTGRTYLYSKTKKEFQDTYSNDFLNYYTADLIASIASLPERQNSLLVIYNFNDSWEGSLLTETTQLIVDDSKAYRNEVMGTKNFDVWSGSLGLSRNESTLTTETVALLKFSIKI